jgi:hypothetical protein
MAKTRIDRERWQVREMISLITDWLKGIGDVLDLPGNGHTQFYYIDIITTTV